MHTILKGGATIISVLFHPLLMFTLMAVLILLADPYGFGVSSIRYREAHLLLMQLFFTSFLIPAIGSVMLKYLGFIQSLQMETREERIGPYIIAMIFYFFLVRNLWGLSSVPEALKTAALGATIGLYLAFFINNFSKISAHAVGMGGLLGMLLLFIFVYGYGRVQWFGEDGYLSTNYVLLIAILLAGLTASARLVLKAHQPTDLLGGFITGLVSQFAAYMIIERFL